jgi:hypothetical protein
MDMGCLFDRPPAYDRHSYCSSRISSATARRRWVERFFNKIKQCRRIATRYDKLAATWRVTCPAVSDATAGIAACSPRRTIPPPPPTPAGANYPRVRAYSWPVVVGFSNPPTVFS